MVRRSDIWTAANELVRRQGPFAPAAAAAKAEELLAKGERSDAVTMRLLADACETLLSERPVASRRTG